MNIGKILKNGRFCNKFSLNPQFFTICCKNVTLFIVLQYFLFNISNSMIFSEKIKILPVLLMISMLFSSCGIYKPLTKPAEPDPKKRVKRNIEEGRGFRLMGGKKGSGNFDFATSNPLWRASIDILDFMPLSTANYSGGLIITDWYSENSSDSEIKVTIKFLSTEIRPDGIDIIVHKRVCENSKCKTSKIKTDLSKELKLAILKKATIYEKQDIKRYGEENPYIGSEGKQE